MFGSLGFPELILIFVVALLVFGPRKLPEVGRTLGKALGEFRRATNDLKHTLEEEVRIDEQQRATTAPTPPAVSEAERITPAPGTIPQQPGTAPPTTEPAVSEAESPTPPPATIPQQPETATTTADK